MTNIYPQYNRININPIGYIYIFFFNTIYQNIFFSIIQKLKIL